MAGAVIIPPPPTNSYRQHHHHQQQQQQPLYPLSKLLILSLTMAGIQLCYAVQIGHGTPELEKLGVPLHWISMAWLAGPLSGLVVQPLVGYMSDRCRLPMGRRRPFLIMGAVLSCAALWVFSHAWELGEVVAKGKRGAGEAGGSQGEGQDQDQEMGSDNALTGTELPWVDSTNRTTSMQTMSWSRDWSMFVVGNEIMHPDADTETSIDAKTDAVKKYRIIIGITGFFFLDFSINAIQGPLRTLLTDVVPPHQLAQGNACMALMVGFGNLVGSWLGAIDLSWVRAKGIHSDIEVLFMGAAVVLIATVGLCVSVIKEVPLDHIERQRATHIAEQLYSSMEKQEGHESKSSDQVLHYSHSTANDTSISSLLKNAPHPFWQTFLVQCCAWYGFFSIMVYVSIWVGRNIYLGDPIVPNTEGYDRYMKGVRVSNLGLSLYAILGMGYSLLLPSMMRRAGTKNMYIFAQMAEGVTLCCCLFVRNKHQIPASLLPSSWLVAITIILIGLFGIPLSSSMTIPWSIMAVTVQQHCPNQVGFYTTIFNASQAGPQLLVSILSPWIIKVTDNVSVIMFIGGIMSLVGAVLVQCFGLGVTLDRASQSTGEEMEMVLTMESEYKSESENESDDEVKDEDKIGKENQNQNQNPNQNPTQRMQRHNSDQPLIA
mmetsp:Transcript_15168/g.26474  ORF Transcript_15168/g.26474 Transcript_15168/m.26474 type:complete len:657 (-) Transcript_15168:45-2015(-)